MAYDKPLTADDANLSPEALRQQRQRWLELHDKQTNGLGGLLPLVKEMPLRVTTTLDRDRAVFKNSRAKLLGWTLPAEEEERILPLDDPEIVLTRRPLSLEIEVETHDAPVTYTLKPQVRVWSRDRERNATVRRVGFPVVPEFGGTAHAYCGTTLESCLGDLLAWHKKPRRDDMLRGYIIKSRVKEWDKILLVQPYSPRLFAQGELPGPSLLMKVLRHEMTTEAARKAWKEQEDSETATGGQEWPQELPLPCRACTDRNGGVEVRKPLRAFTIKTTLGDLWQDAVAHGQDLLCVACRQLRWRERDRSKIMLCDLCSFIRHETKFTSESKRRWREESDEPIVCNECSGDRATRTIADAELFACTGAHCARTDGATGETEQRRVPESWFDEDRLLQWRAQEQMHLARCVRCELVSCADGAEDVRIPCKRCGVSKALVEYAGPQVKWLRVHISGRRDPWFARPACTRSAIVAVGGRRM